MLCVQHLLHLRDTVSLSIAELLDTIHDIVHIYTYVSLRALCAMIVLAHPCSKHLVHSASGGIPVVATGAVSQNRICWVFSRLLDHVCQLVIAILALLALPHLSLMLVCSLSMRSHVEHSLLSCLSDGSVIGDLIAWGSCSSCKLHLSAIAAIDDSCRGLVRPVSKRWSGLAAGSWLITCSYSARRWARVISSSTFDWTFDVNSSRNDGSSRLTLMCSSAAWLRGTF